jgi:hypothetical protein
VEGGAVAVTKTEEDITTNLFVGEAVGTFCVMGGASGRGWGGVARGEGGERVRDRCKGGWGY